MIMSKGEVVLFKQDTITPDMYEGFFGGTDEDYTCWFRWLMEDNEKGDVVVKRFSEPEEGDYSYTKNYTEEPYERIFTGVQDLGEL